ncbi:MULTISPECIES: hypothetical protein [Thiorhodovibrio]|uniref:hypothetical protein n=1 Tax=Thiorhodovibrio TaxID=61593 RepID=UPI002B263EBA|nr:hypothetical protein [Thiorhodovibrio litoralis]
MPDAIRIQPSGGIRGADCLSGIKWHRQQHRSGVSLSFPFGSARKTTAMPYFVYKISPKRQLTYIDTKDRYQEARTLVRDLRAKAPADENGEFRLIFANQQGEAEKMLSTPRDERVIGED